jgi:hypothetical protein
VGQSGNQTDKAMKRAELAIIIERARQMEDDLNVEESATELKLFREVAMQTLVDSL